jgi:predicted nucleic acid-binding protein
MPERVVFDTWAWFHVLDGTRVGARLRTKYLETGPVDTVDLSLAEVSIRMTGPDRDAADTATAIDTIVDATELSGGSILSLDPEEAKAAGPLRAALRRVNKDASLVDAVILAVARSRGCRVVSCDPAYEGQPDVLCEQ